MKKKFWILLMVSWIIVPQLFIKVLQDFLNTNALQTRIWLLFLTGVTLAAVYTIRLYAYENRLKEILFKEWDESKYPGQSSKSSIPSVQLEENPPRIVPTEAVLAQVSQSLLFFFPSTPIVLNEIYGRIKRVYSAGYSKKDYRIGNPFFGENPSVLIELLPSHIENSTSINQAFSLKIGDLFTDPSDQETLEKLLRRREKSVLLLVHAIDSNIQELKEWLVPLPKWVYKVVIAIRPKERDKVGNTFGQQAIIFNPKLQNRPPFLVSTLENQLEVRMESIAEELNSPVDEVGEWLRQIALAFQIAELSHPDNKRFRKVELKNVPDNFFALAELIGDWIGLSGNVNRRTYFWKSNATLIRDFMVASQLYHQSIDDFEGGILQQINCSSFSPYIRPFLNWFARKERESGHVPGKEEIEHVLSNYPLTPAHRIIETAWKNPPDITQDRLQDLDEVLNTDAKSLLDWRDVAHLLPELIKKGDSNKYIEICKDIPSSLRVKSIIECNTSGERIAKALNALTQATDIWLYFEEGGIIPEQTQDRLLIHYDMKVLQRLTQTMIVAPHGVFPGEQMLRFLRGDFDECWEYVREIPMDLDDVHHVASRVRSTERLLAERGRLWINGMVPHVKESPWLMTLWNTIQKEN